MNLKFTYISLHYVFFLHFRRRQKKRIRQQTKNQKKTKKKKPQNKEAQSIFCYCQGKNLFFHPNFLKSHLLFSVSNNFLPFIVCLIYVQHLVCKFMNLFFYLEKNSYAVDSWKNSTFLKNGSINHYPRRVKLPLTRI